MSRNKRVILLVLRWIIDACAVVVALFLFFWIWALIHGSFEMFPTPEEHGKARIGAVICIIPLVIAETVLISLRIKLHRKIKAEKETHE